jgi:hypothetical protein
MEVQKITGHKTLAMLLRYTQMDVRHIVERLDETESTNAVTPDDAILSPPVRTESVKVSCHSAVAAGAQIDVNGA